MTNWGEQDSLYRTGRPDKHRDMKEEQSGTTNGNIQKPRRLTEI